MRKFFLYLRNRLVKQQKYSPSVSFLKAEKVGILLYNPDFNLNQEIEKFVRFLEEKGKQVEVICFLDKEVNRLYNFNYIPVRISDISVFGAFKNEKINKFIKTRFDYLYCINNLPFLPFENLLLRTEAGVKVGKYFPGSQQYLDIMIDQDPKAGLGNLVDRMIELISNLNFHV